MLISFVGIKWSFSNYIHDDAVLKVDLGIWMRAIRPPKLLFLLN